MRVAQIKWFSNNSVHCKLDLKGAVDFQIYLPPKMNTLYRVCVMVYGNLYMYWCINIVLSNLNGMYITTGCPFPQTLGFLAQDGILRFINIHSCRLLFQVGSQENMLSSAHVGPEGNTLVCISERGNILIYDVPTAAQGLHRVRCIALYSETCLKDHLYPETTSL